MKAEDSETKEINGTGETYSEAMDESGNGKISLTKRFTDGLERFIRNLGVKKGAEISTAQEEELNVAQESLDDSNEENRLDNLVLKIENVTKTYELDGVSVNALKGVSLKVKRGEFVAIMGASGSGKSTLMNIVGCLDRPSSGRVLVDNVDINTLSDNELADLRNKKIGFVFQSFNLLSRTAAMDNVEMPLLYSGMARADRKKTAEDALTSVGLGHRMHHHPSQLSGGEQQRVAIARALINDPSILLADEPTGNLDSKSGIEIMKILNGMNEAGITIVMVTHDRDVGEQAERIVNIKDGIIISEDLVNKKGFYKMLEEHQVKDSEIEEESEGWALRDHPHVRDEIDEIQHEDCISSPEMLQNESKEGMEERIDVAEEEAGGKSFTGEDPKEESKRAATDKGHMPEGRDKDFIEEGFNEDEKLIDAITKEEIGKGVFFKTKKKKKGRGRQSLPAVTWVYRAIAHYGIEGAGPEINEGFDLRTLRRKRKPGQTKSKEEGNLRKPKE